MTIHLMPASPVTCACVLSEVGGIFDEVQHHEGCPVLDALEARIHEQVFYASEVSEPDAPAAHRVGPGHVRLNPGIDGDFEPFSVHGI